MSMSWQQSVPTPALFAPPPGAASLDEAHAAIDQWEHYSGKRLDTAQRLAVELMMAEGADGLWAARTTARVVARQNGKGDEFEVVEAWGLTQRAEAIVHTAHEIPTAKSAHLRLVAHLEGHRDLRRLVRKIRYANGDQAIEMHNDGVIVYRTRTSGGGRGLDDISRLIVDEAQHAQPEQLASATPILAANPNPQINFAGTAGIEGVSAWWWKMRRRALEGGEGQFSYLEHSAEVVTLGSDGKVVSIGPDPTDRDAWRRGNPGYPDRVPADFLAEQLAILGPSLFLREHGGVWDPEPDANADRIIPAQRWLECSQPHDRGERVKHSVDVSPDGVSAAIGASDGVVGLILDHGPGTAWVIPKLLKRGITKVWLDPKGPAGALLVPLGEAGIEVEEVSPAEHAQACGGLLAAIIDATFRHTGQPALDAAVENATRRPYGDAWAWNRRTASVDISPLVAITLARWAAAQSDNDLPFFGAWR